MASFFNFLLNAVTRSGLIRFMTLPELVKEYFIWSWMRTPKKLADKVCQAKKGGLIDNFIYGSVSSTYLSAVIDAL